MLISQGSFIFLAVAAIGRVGKESCEPIPVFSRIAVYADAAVSGTAGCQCRIERWITATARCVAVE